MATDYRTRLTADTSQHDKAISKSAQQIYRYKKQTDTAKATLSDLAKKFGPLAAQIGVAGGALAALKKTITSTELGSDAFNRTLHIGKQTVDIFFQSLSTGNFDAFLTGLKNITKTAQEAFDALDALGTITNYNNAAVAELQAKIEQQRTIALSPKSTAEQKRAAEKLIREYEKEIKALNSEILKAGENAASKLIAELAKNPTLKEQDIETWLNMKAHGTLAEELRKYKTENSWEVKHTGTTQGNRFSGPSTYDWTETKWNEGTKEIYDAMQAVLNASEAEGNSYAEWLKVRTANAQRIIQQEKDNQRNNKLTAKLDKLEAKPNFQEGSIADIEHQIDELRKRLKNEALQGNEVAALQRQVELLEVKKDALESLQQPLKKIESAIEDLPTIDGKLIDSDAINAELQSVIDNIKDVGLSIDELQNLAAVGDSIGYIGDMFVDLSNVVGDESGKIFAALGNSIGAIGTAIAKVSSLMMAEGAASVMDLPYPANLAALASVIAAVTAVIGSIQSIAAQSFAEGGIVQGKTTIGDYNLARLNAGEMVLDTTAQAKLFKMLNGPTVTTTMAGGGNVTFTIHGSDLYGTLSNYDKKIKRVK